MDVTCERCGTEYEFDDALVSERGTTVKCTNCGHQFKVRRTDGATTSERWLVRTVDGRELEFNALRELQAAIASSKISKDDVLSRDNSRPRRLGSIAELEPFFASAGGPFPSTAPGLGGASAPRARIPTPAGLGAMPQTAAYRNEGSVAIPLPIAPPRKPTLEGGFERGEGDSAQMPPLAPRRPAVFQSTPPPPMALSPIAVPTPRVPARNDWGPGTGPTLPGVVVGPGDAPPVPPAIVRTDGEGREGEFGATRPSAQSPMANAPIFAGAAADLGRTIPDDAPTQRRAVVAGSPLAPVAYGPDAGLGGGTPHPGRSSEAPMASGRRQVSSNPDLGHGPTTPTPTDVRASYIHDESAPTTEPRFSSLTPSKQTGRTRWIAGVVVLGLLTFTVIAMGRKYLSAGPRPAPTAAAQDDRVTALLSEGEKALLEGDLEIAKEHVDKASALAENDPRVVSQQARVAILRAEIPWLLVRIGADGGASTDDPVAKKELEVAAERARKAADRAAQLAGTDPAVIRYRIDALRLSGDTAGARKLVSSVTGGLGVSSSQPESAVVLAGLDLAEDKPDWRTVIERLRTAASSEQNLGRARALLVYALVRSGATADAKAELDRLAALPRPHPLVQPLKALVEKSGGKAAVDVGSLPNAKNENAKNEPKTASAKPDPGAPKEKGDKGDKGTKPGGRRTEDGRVPDDYVFPGSGADTSDLPGHAPPKPNQPAPAPAPDTGDLPGGKP